MIPLMIVIALQWMPAEPITAEPSYPAPIEVIDLGPSVEEMERALQRNEGECND